MGFPLWKKWTITLLVAFATLAVSFISSAYTGGIQQIIEEFGASEEVVTLGVSLLDSPLDLCSGPHYPSYMAGRSSFLPLMAF